jgi:ribosomal protein S18
MDQFSFNKFKTRFGITGGDLTNILYYYEKRIKEFLDNNQFSSRTNYMSSSQMLKKFIGNSKRIDFRKITPNLLNKYERWLIDRGLSLSTVRCYVISTRALFRKAQNDGAIPLDIYPFGPN